MTTTANTHNQVVAQDVRNAGFKTTLGPASFNNMKQNQYEWRDVKGKPGRKAKASLFFQLASSLPYSVPYRFTQADVEDLQELHRSSKLFGATLLAVPLLMRRPKN